MAVGGGVAATGALAVGGGLEGEAAGDCAMAFGVEKQRYDKRKTHKKLPIVVMMDNLASYWGLYMRNVCRRENLIEIKYCLVNYWRERCNVHVSNVFLLMIG